MFRKFNLYYCYRFHVPMKNILQMKYQLYTLDETKTMKNSVYFNAVIFNSMPANTIFFSTHTYEYTIYLSANFLYHIFFSLVSFIPALVFFTDLTAGALVSVWSSNIYLCQISFLCLLFICLQHYRMGMLDLIHQDNLYLFVHRRTCWGKREIGVH